MISYVQQLCVLERRVL